MVRMVLENGLVMQVLVGRVLRTVRQPLLLRRRRRYGVGGHELIETAVGQLAAVVRVSVRRILTAAQTARLLAGQLLLLTDCGRWTGAFRATVMAEVEARVVEAVVRAAAA